MKTFPFLFVSLLLGANLPVLARPDALLIVPGHGIGRTPLGPNGTAFLGRLPPPAAGNDGMQQEHLVWTFKTRTGALQTLYIHTVTNAALNVRPLNGVTIDEIRVTSSKFHTRGGLRTGSTLAAVRRQFPHLRPLRWEPHLYDDARRGIAFEFAGTRCTAITVYPPGKSNVDVDNAATVSDLLKNGKNE